MKGWQAFRSDPGLAEKTGIWRHLAAILLTMLASLVLAPVAAILSWISDLWIGASHVTDIFMVSTMVLFFAPMYSWIGQIPGAFVMQLAMRRGWAGWGSAALAGLGLGTVLAVLMGTPIALVFAVAMAVAQTAILRGLIVGQDSRNRRRSAV